MRVSYGLFAVLCGLACLAKAEDTTMAPAKETEALGVHTRVVVGTTSDVLAVPVQLLARVDHPVAGHTYQLIYQLRLHAKKGENGPILGDATMSDGRAYVVGTLVHPKGLSAFRYNRYYFSVPQPSFQEPPKADTDGVEIAETVDVTRKELSAMTNLPEHGTDVVVRIEPQVYDVTTKTFLTPSRSPAVLLFLDIGDPARVTQPRDPADPPPSKLVTPDMFPIPGWHPPHPRQVTSVRSFESWFPSQFTLVSKAKRAIRILEEADTLETYDQFHTRTKAFVAVLGADNVAPAAKTIAVRGVPLELLRTDIKSRELYNVVAKLGETAEGDLKVAVDARLGEVRKRDAQTPKK